MTDFPFTAVVGQDQLKLALLLNAIDPRIGGVLIRGDKGSGKSTLARAISDLLPNGSPFIEVPAGSTEDRVKGSIDLEAMVSDGTVKARGGLLADAHGGVLYVDEVNLLQDHIVDLLLDSAATGINRIERDGVSAIFPAKYVLVGSMNPEEGELRPQLLDRFGLCVDSNPIDLEKDRVLAVSRRLEFDVDPISFIKKFLATQDDLKDSLVAARAQATELSNGISAVLPEELLHLITRLCIAFGAEGLRADLTLSRASAAHAAFCGREVVEMVDIEVVAPLVLMHRSRKNPLDGLDGDNSKSLSDLIDQLGDSTNENESDLNEVKSHEEMKSDPNGGGDDEPKSQGNGMMLSFGQLSDKLPLSEGSDANSGSQSHRLGDGAFGLARSGYRARSLSAFNESSSNLEVVGTLTNATIRRSVVSSQGNDRHLERSDLVFSEKKSKLGRSILVLLDLSGSVGVQSRMELASIVIESLLLDAYQSRDQLGLIVLSQGEAKVIQRPTRSVEMIRAKLKNISSGGVTPLAGGIRLLREQAELSIKQGESPYLILITDGRATGSDNAFEVALREAEMIRTAGYSSCVIDIEDSKVPLGLAREFAEVLRGDLIHHGSLVELIQQSQLRNRLFT